MTADSLGLEPKSESLRWTSYVRARPKSRHELDHDGQDLFSFPFMDTAVILEHAFERSRRGTHSLEVRIDKGTEAWFEEAHVHRRKSVSLKHKCAQMVNHIYSVASFRSETWSWSQQSMKEIEKAGDRNDGRIFRFKKKDDDESWAFFASRCSIWARAYWQKLGLPHNDRSGGRQDVERYGMGEPRRFGSGDRSPKSGSLRDGETDRRLVWPQTPQMNKDGNTQGTSR